MTGRLEISSFSLHDTLECGQFFRFTRVEDRYLVQSSGRLFYVWQKKNTLCYEGVEESFITRFFRLDDPFEPMMKQIDRDPLIHTAIRQYRGLRLIRQDPWECLLSYLCSSAKAIPHIRSILEALCRSSGRKICWGNHISYTFPDPGHLDSIHQLDRVGAGFRASFLLEAGQRIDRNRLDSLKALPYEEAKQFLMELPGVGKKVADCVLLYSLDFLEAFPIDTWIHRGLQESYFKGKKMNEKKIEAFVRDHFGPLAGVAQLYLYHFWRHQKVTP